MGITPELFEEDGMHFQYVVAPPTAAFPVPPPTPSVDSQASLFRELIDVQREQLAYLRRT